MIRGLLLTTCKISCAYHEEFAEEKLIWIVLVEKGRFAFDESGIYCENSAFMMIGESLKYLCAVLNSKLTGWFLQHTARTSGMGTLQWEKVYVETIPIPKIPTAKQLPFTELVDRILAAKAKDSSTDTSNWETEIDLLVYKLYDLTAKEIATVEK